MCTRHIINRNLKRNSFEYVSCCCCCCGDAVLCSLLVGCMNIFVLHSSSETWGIIWNNKYYKCCKLCCKDLLHIVSRSLSLMVIIINSCAIKICFNLFNGIVIYFLHSLLIITIKITHEHSRRRRRRRIVDREIKVRFISLFPCQC